MAKLMMRKARDDFEAWLTAQAMENSGAEVISVVYDGQHQQDDALIPCSKFVVFARVPDALSIDDIDDAIDEAIDGKGR